MKKKKNYLMKFLLSLIIASCNFPCLIAQQNSESGYGIPVHTPTATPLKVMLVFAEAVGGSCGDAAQPNWPAGSLPTNAGNYFDAFLPVGGPTSYITKIYHDASFGQFILLGDYVNQVIQVPCALANNPFGNVLTQLNTILSSPGQHFGDPNTQLSDFDKYTVPSPYAGLIKPPSTNTMIDFLVICWRNIPIWGCNQGYGCTPGQSQITPIGPFTGFENGCAYRMCADIGGFKFMLQEIFHAMYGGNNWHSGDLTGTFMAATEPWGLCTQSIGGGMSNVVCGWDRKHLGWNNPPDKNMLISARDGNNINAEVATDLNIITNPVSSSDGTYILRDFVTYGDALQIKLPHINWQNYGDVKSQYLWIENHQLWNVYDHDANWTNGEGCGTDWVPGIYSQIQVGKDQKDENNIPNIFSTDNFHPNGSGGWLLPLTADGNYDYVYGPNATGPAPCGWTITNPPTTITDKYSPDVKPNPFTGWSDLYGLPNTDNSDYIGDNPAIDGGTNMGIYFPAGGPNILWNRLGRGNDAVAFHCDFGCPIDGKKILSIATNPASVPVYTFRTGSYSDPRGSYENDKIWLNGLSITILEENIFSTGAVKLKVRWDDYDVDRDVRWCSNIILSQNDFNVAQPSLNLKDSKTILLDRGKSPTEFEKVEEINGEKYFTKPTVLTCLPNSYFHLEPNSTVIVDNGSTLKLNDNSKLEIESGAQVIVRNGSKLILEAGSNLIVHDGGEVIIESTGTLEYGENTNTLGLPLTNIELNGVSALLEIQGNLNIKDNSNFTFIHSTSQYGFVRFSNTTTWPTQNVTAGINCSMTFTGTNKYKKFLEITQESLYTPDNLVLFSASSGTIAIGADSRLQMSGGQTDINFNNARITSTIRVNDPGNPNPYNAHRGLTLFGQQNISINNGCIFEYGKYGIYAFLTYSGYPLNISNSIFRNCNTGLWTQDKGVYLHNCFFYDNISSGWYALAMSFPCKTDYGHIGYVSNPNPTGINFSGTGSSNLYMVDPAVIGNNTGIYVTRTPLYVQCGAVASNTSYGIYLNWLSSLDMSYDVYSTGQSAQVTATNNGTTIFADYASIINLNGGYNDLTPLTSGTQNAVNGILYSCAGNASIDANNNKWNSAGNPISSADYYLQGDLFGPCSITINDFNSIVPVPCGQAVPTCPECRDNDPLYVCPDCDEITTEDFDETQINEATQTAIGTMQNTQAENNFREAVSLFYQILTADIENPTADEMQVLSLGHKKMLESLGSAFLSGQITRAENSVSLAIEIVETIEVLDNIIEEASDTSSYDYNKLITASMEKADVYRLADRRELALPILDNILAWAEEDDLPYVQSYRCQTNIEHLTLLNEVAKQDVETIMENPCDYTPNNFRTDGQNYADLDNQSSLHVAPNPAMDFTVFTYSLPSSEEQETLLITDISGRVINEFILSGKKGTITWNTKDISKGLYLFFIKGNSSPQTRGKILVNK
ncbi:MAG TPA: T9SS type A sorting domain-containing protein [Bacteroidia bacterium]|nr:T9SS type A sorting domain-containing protein [Bacteroidia bacterium]